MRCIYRIDKVRKDSLIVMHKNYHAGTFTIVKKRDEPKLSFVAKILLGFFGVKAERELLDTNVVMEIGNQDMSLRIMILNDIKDGIIENEKIYIVFDEEDNYYLSDIWMETEEGSVQIGWHDLERRAGDLGLKMLPTVARPFLFGSKWNHINTEHELMEYAEDLRDKDPDIILRIEDNRGIYNYDLTRML